MYLCIIPLLEERSEQVRVDIMFSLKIDLLTFERRISTKDLVSSQLVHLSKALEVICKPYRELD